MNQPPPISEGISSDNGEISATEEQVGSDKNTRTQLSPAELQYPPRIMCGIQPTTTVHLGHYFGALKHHIQLHHEYPGECFFMVADYHAMTRGGIDAERIRQGTLELATVYLALGLNPSKAVLYRQSDVPKVTELSWILACLTPLDWLTSNPTYSAAQTRVLVPGSIESTDRSNSSGLLWYAVLMAADVLALRATVIPVECDLKADVELVRKIASAFNRNVGRELFPIPHALHFQSSIVRGIDGKKMLTESDNFIPVFARFDQLRDRIKRINTSRTPSKEPANPDACLVFHLYSLVAPPNRVEEMKIRYRSTQTIDYEEAKRELLQECQECFSQFQDHYYKLKQEPDTVWDVLRAGFKAARDEAEGTLDAVRSISGLSY
jgi:tryptophanyl-tRNA synthetase